MTDEFEAKPGTALHMPLLSEALINFAFNQAQEFVDSGQSVREATSICANLLLDAAWKVAGAGAAADGFVPNKDKFRARVEEVLQQVSFSKADEEQASSDLPPANPDTPPPSTHVRVDFNKLYSHPLAQGFYDLTQQIERLGTSPEMTSVIVAVQSVKSQVEAEINRLLQNAASDGALLTRYHRWCEKNGCAPSTSDLYGDGPTPSPQPNMTGWQDISTAPKNTKVLAAYRNELGNWRIVTACYHTELPWSDEYGDHGEEFAPEAWYEESDSSEVIYQTSRQPTHWQPLPAPPATTEGSDNG